MSLSKFGGTQVIGEMAFYQCTGLESITVAQSVGIIRKSAFSGCEHLSSIHFDGTVQQWLSIYKEIRWNEKLPAYTVYCMDGETTK